MGKRMRDVVASLAEDSTLRAVVITGAGRAFSAGGDMDFLKRRTESNADTNTAAMMNFYSSFLSVREIPVPVLAAINGHAVGAGLCVALACDLRIVQRGAKVGVNFVRLGLHPGMASTHSLPLLLGQQNAARLLLTGDLVSAEEAVSLGLALSMADDALAEALRLAERIAAASPHAVRATLRTLRTKWNADLQASLWREADAQAHSYATRDMQEGLRAIKEKRDPVFGADFNVHIKP